MFTDADGKASKFVAQDSFIAICPDSICNNTGIDLNWPDNLSKMAVVDPQDLYLYGI